MGTQSAAPPAPGGLWSEDTLAQVNQSLEGATPQQTLAWAVDTFGRDLTLACSFGGISGMALLDMALELDPGLSVFYVDTDLLSPETYATRDAAARRYRFQPIA